MDTGGEVVDGREVVLPLVCLSIGVSYAFSQVIKEMVSLAIIRT